MGLRQSFARNAVYRSGEEWSVINGQEWMRYHDLTTRTVGLIGLSQVGQRMPNLLSNFGCRLLAYDPYWKPAAARDHGVHLLRNLDDLLKQSDVVSLHTPVTNETER